MHMCFQDEASNSGSIKTVVEVIDMPDQPPRWSQLTTSITINEKTLHVRITHLHDTWYSI